MEINAARFLIMGNTMEIWQTADPDWRFYNLAYRKQQFVLNSAGEWTAPTSGPLLGCRHHRFAVIMAHIRQHAPSLDFSWWRRQGKGTTIDVEGFCMAGHRLIYWPSNWCRFCHVIQVSPLVFLGWRDGAYYVRASAQRKALDVDFRTTDCRQAMARAVRVKMAREQLSSELCRFSPIRDQPSKRQRDQPVTRQRDQSVMRQRDQSVMRQRDQHPGD